MLKSKATPVNYDNQVRLSRLKDFSVKIFPKVESALSDRIYRFYGVVFPFQQNIESYIKEKHLRQRKFFQADLM